MISDRLSVTPASATEMVDRLAADGLVVREPRGDVWLTDRGATVAAELAWRRDLVRRFLDEISGDDVASRDATTDPEVAYRIGYHLPSDAVDRLEGLATDGQ